MFTVYWGGVVVVVSVSNVYLKTGELRRDGGSSKRNSEKRGGQKDKGKAHIRSSPGYGVDWVITDINDLDDNFYLAKIPKSAAAAAAGDGAALVLVHALALVAAADTDTDADAEDAHHTSPWIYRV